MENNTLVMREEEMNTAISGLDKCYTDTEATGKNMTNNFASIRKAGLFDVGINKINKQISSLTTSLFNVKNIVNKNSNEMFEMDRQLANIANNIEIPQDFVKNNSIFTTEFKDMVMEKNDGTSVNQGQKTTNNVDINTQSSIIKNTIENINNQNILNNAQYEDNIIGNKQNLENIDNNQSTVEQKLNDNFSTTNVNLQNINNSQNITEQEINNQYSVSKTNLSNIKNDQVINNNQLNDENFNYISSTSVEIPKQSSKDSQ